MPCVRCLNDDSYLQGGERRRGWPVRWGSEDGALPPDLFTCAPYITKPVHLCATQNITFIITESGTESGTVSQDLHSCSKQLERHTYLDSLDTDTDVRERNDDSGQEHKSGAAEMVSEREYDNKGSYGDATFLEEYGEEDDEHYELNNDVMIAS